MSTQKSSKASGHQLLGGLFFVLMLTSASHAAGIPNELDGKVTVVSQDRQLCEVRFPNAATCEQGTKLRILRGSGAVWKEVGVLEVVAVSGKKIAGRCEGFAPRAGDVVEAPPVATRPIKDFAKKPASRFAGGQSAADAKVAMALEEPVTVDVVDMPLSEAMDYLAALRGIRILLDARSLDAVGLKADTPVTFNVAGIKLKALLESMLDDLDLKYGIENGALVIVSKTVAEGRKLPAVRTSSPARNAAAKPSKPRKPPTAEISYAMDYDGMFVRGISTFIFTVAIQEVDESKGKALVRLERIRRHWTAISHAGSSGLRETNIGSMPFTDPRGYKEYGGPAAWGKSVRIGDTAWIRLADLKNKRGEAGAVSETGKAETQMAVGAVVVGGIAAAASDRDRPAEDGGTNFRVGQRVRNRGLLHLWYGTIVRVEDDASYLIRMDYVANLSGNSPYREKREYYFVAGEFKER